MIRAWRPAASRRPGPSLSTPDRADVARQHARERRGSTIFEKCPLVCFPGPAPTCLPPTYCHRHIGAWSLAMAAKYPEVLVRLDGAGDDFRIVGQVTKAMRRVGITEEEIENFCDEAISGRDHDLLRICGRWVTLAPGWPENRD
jgi:hypothetical protein